MKQFIILSFLIYLSACGTTTPISKTTVEETTTTAQRYSETITAEELKTLLYTYASDDFEGRETGQPGQKKAIEFLKNKYQSLNIQSVKNNGDYFQEVPLEIIKVPEVLLTINNKLFKNIDDFVSVSSSETGNLNADKIVYLAYGIDSETYSNYKNIDVSDKIVVIKSGEPINSNDIYTISGTKEPSKWSDFKQEYKLKYDAAIEKGAKAVLFYNPSVYDYISQRFGKSGDRMQLKDKKLSNTFYFFINTDLAKTLVPNIETQNTAKIIETDFSLNYQNNSKTILSENVAAYIKGSEKPDEFIIISAHLDHEGIKNGEIYNGADDDGSGTVAILEIAEAFKKAQEAGNGPKRSIMFLNVTAEEKGLLGSSYYTDIDPLIPLENTVANLNIDMIGRIDPKHENTTNTNYLYLIGSDKLSTELHNISEAVNKDCCNLFLDYTYNDENDPNRFYYRSDHYNFAKNNIPVIFYFNGTHEDYHQPTDTPDKIKYDLLKDRTQLIFHTAWELANRKDRIIVDKAHEKPN